MKHSRCYLNITKYFFTVRMTERWQRVPREVVESPSLELSKHIQTHPAQAGIWIKFLVQSVVLASILRRYKTPSLHICSFCL